MVEPCTVCYGGVLCGKAVCCVLERCVAVGGKLEFIALVLTNLSAGGYTIPRQGLLPNTIQDCLSLHRA